MDPLMLSLRLVHVLGGAFWFGAALLMAGFVEPAAASLGPEGGRFMHRLMGSRLPIVMTGAAALTVLSGLGLYLKHAGELTMAWVLSGAGLGFLAGGLAGLLAFASGFLLVRPAVEELGHLASRLAATNSPDASRLAATNSPDLTLVRRLQALEQALRRCSIVNAVLLLVAMAAMATARYVP
jgi:hypothetical protein